MEYLFYHLILTNGVSFSLFGLDKYLAKNRFPRIPEKLLYFTSYIGGSPGSILGMIIFRHKIKKIKFIIISSSIFIFQISLIKYLL